MHIIPNRGGIIVLFFSLTQWCIVVGSFWFTIGIVNVRNGIIKLFDLFSATSMTQYNVYSIQVNVTTK